MKYRLQGSHDHPIPVQISRFWITHINYYKQLGDPELFITFNLISNLINQYINTNHEITQEVLE